MSANPIPVAATLTASPDASRPGGQALTFFIRAYPSSLRATVHRADCPHCRSGRGHPRQGHKPKHQHWLGPHATQEAAMERALQGGLSKVSSCGHCLP